MQIYVSASVKRSGDGSQAAPFQTINEAAQVAVAGDEVIVLPGYYREWVDPKNGARPTTAASPTVPRCPAAPSSPARRL